MPSPLENARGLYLTGIRDGRPEEALAAHVGDRYTQHSTKVRDGREGFLAFFGGFLANNPERDIRVVRAIEDGRYAFVQVAQVLPRSKWITMDLFDTDEDGKIVEHWDVIIRWQGDDSQLSGPTAPTDLDRTDANKAVVRSFLTEVFQNGDLGRLDDFVSADFVQHDPGVPAGREGLRAWLGTQLAAGLRYTMVFRVVGQGSLVATYSQAERPTGDTAVFNLWRVADGRVAEHWIAEEPIPPRAQWVNSGKF